MNRTPEDIIQIQLELMTALGRSSGLHETLEHCYDAAVRVSGMDSGGIYLASSDGGLHLRLHHGLGEVFIQTNGVVSPDDPRVALVRAGQATYTSLSHLRARLGRDHPGDQFEGLKALAVVPILCDGEMVGCMNLASHTMEVVPERSRTLLEVLAGQIAQSISREVAITSLREREENLNTFFQSVDDLLVVLDARALVLKINPAVTRLLGLAEADLLGRPVTRLHPEARRDDAARVLQEVVVGHPRSYEAPLVRHDGGLVPAEIRVTRGTWDGAPASFCVIRDLSAQEEAREERLALERQIQQAQRLESLGLMAGGIAHDFNNILVSVLGSASQAANEAPRGSPVHPHLDTIVAGARQAADLCKQMLAYSGRGRFIIEPIDLSARVRDLSRLIRTSSRQVEVELHLAEPLCCVEGDATQLSQVIMNLTLNAVEAMEGRDGAVHVRTGEETLDAARLATMISAGATPGDFAYLEVSDQGVGMTPETVEHLFDPFFTTKATGHGLGMSAVLGIVRGHGGALSLHTVRGEGSTFRAYFPASAATVSPTPAPAPQREGHAARVLLVDDDHTVLQVMARILTRAGLEVTQAQSGHEALALFATSPEAFDLVLLDLTMPQLDGAATLARLSAIDPHVPVVIMSGYTEQELNARFKEQRPTAFLGKPFSRDDLLHTIQRHARAPQQTR